ncbi:MAG: hypothetical protein Ctma_0918 [Catillopecten margaritatus gill symbiont]|uniref:Type II toxin-antitoxin system HicA family toxin n=1 Tax=Catillopecten margaritatus gill symbiont TaxID=3083288 RepID=A0AAU6PGV0_9GAMM
MNSKHQKTLNKLMERPVLANIKFNDVDKLLVAMGFQRIEREGSRVCFKKEEDEIVLHKPHPRNELLKYIVRDLQMFIKHTGDK